MLGALYTFAGFGVLYGVMLLSKYAYFVYVLRIDRQVVNEAIHKDGLFFTVG